MSWEALTTRYEQCQALLQSTTVRQAELDGLMEGADHGNPHQRIHLHAMIKEENRMMKEENEGLRREVVRWRREVRRLGGSGVVEEGEGKGRRDGIDDGSRTREGKENAQEGSGKMAKRKVVGPRHRSALSSIH